MIESSVVGDEDSAGGYGVGGNLQVEFGERFSSLGQLDAELAVSAGGGKVPRQDGECFEELLHGLAALRGRRFLLQSEQQLTSRDGRNS